SRSDSHGSVKAAAARTTASTPAARNAAGARWVTLGALVACGRSPAPTASHASAGAVRPGNSQNQSIEPWIAQYAVAASPARATPAARSVLRKTGATAHTAATTKPAKRSAPTRPV